MNVFKGVEFVLRTLEERTQFGALIIFGFVVGMSSILQWGVGFSDPDAFYHAKLTELIVGGDFVRSFKWLPLTILSDSFADHHLIYHFILAPFVSVFGGLFGVKISIPLFAGAIAVMFYGILKRYFVPGAFWFTFLLCTATPFLLRMNLAKALPLSLIFYFVGLVALNERRYLLLFLVSFFYVWAYAGWPILVVTSFIFAVTYFIIESRSILLAARIFFSSALGSALGLIINPYFPNHFLFYWNQIVSIALVPTVRKGIGSEWYPISFSELFVAIGPLFIVVIIITIIAIASYLFEPERWLIGDKKEQVFRYSLSTISFALFVMTLLFRRYMEYLIPVGYLTVALWFLRCYSLGVVQLFWHTIKNSFNNKYLAQVALTLIIFINFFIFPAKAFFDVKETVQKNKNIYFFKNTAIFLSTLPNNNVIFNLEWDKFPQLFYFNDSIKYAWGLDARFWKGDPNEPILARQKLLEGEAEQLTILLHKVSSKYFVVSSRDLTPKVARELGRAKYKLLYHDNEGSVYAVPE